ncbi:MAG: pilus assembly protein PilO [Acidiferrobacteraceae bacterium]|jgi:type IV pilus assembly protein PilO|nr:pilus assembly protein PilO [Acidiferrobacteraceae bacterium]MDP6397931.1 type 4a pilus biogenesis protein PilO [Arenicellales bacterium]MDP6550843.1 type 4a pilus biogenesis protein PilO [Arenicellales bacterium]MDP6790781.1 type 4a pilus biogenesis protein PilO [Arenicellales bacterium]MDP6917877.1 type 4a pilus biogenesis protein PilO [Arenicellales bacterium]|tara:strand:+ start:10466 stop:11050 length:585 start_codon:yes stop_codon:yes gene_type:complete
MSWLDDFRAVDINQPAEWPPWFVVVVSLLACLVLLFGGWQFLIRDQRLSLDYERAQELELRRTFTIKKGMVVNLPAYQAQMIQIKEMLAELVQQLPDSSEVPSLLIDITEAGGRRGLEFVVFDPQEQELGDFYSTLPILMEVKGNYHQLGNFISDLAQMPRIVTVGDLEITADEDGVLTSSLVLKTYSYLAEGL